MIQSSSLMLESSVQRSCQVLGDQPEQWQLQTDHALEFLAMQHHAFETTPR